MKKLIFVGTLLLSCVLVQAQDINQVVAGSKSDISNYMNAYFKPFGEGQIHNLSRGWFSSGRAHKFLGFDLSVRAQFAVIPTGQEYFTFKNSDYQSFKLEGGATSASLPTYMGGTTTQNININTQISSNGNTYTGTATFKAPDGIGDDFKKISGIPLAVPLPIAQLGIGLIKHTDVKIRYVPKTEIGDNKSSVDVFGVAIQHEFSNYLPFIKKAPFLHFSVLAGYTKVNVKYSPSFEGGGPVTGNNSLFDYSISAFTVQGIASAKLAFLEVYTAIGYSKGKSTLDVLGTYTAKYNTGFPPPNSQVTASVTNPASLSFEGSGVTNTTGVRINLIVLKLFADYTFGTYKGIGAGVAISIR